MPKPNSTNRRRPPTVTAEMYPTGQIMNHYRYKFLCSLVVELQAGGQDVSLANVNRLLDHRGYGPATLDELEQVTGPLGDDNVLAAG